MLAGAPARTVNAALLPDASVSPPLRDASSTTPLSATLYVSPLTVHALVFAAIVHEGAPPSVPVPLLTLRTTPVFEPTTAGLPDASFDCTATLKGVAAVGLPPALTLAIASCDAAESTVKL